MDRANRSPESFLDSIHVSVVIPAYQAERSLSVVISGIPKFVRSIIAVADGCRDQTLRVMEEVAQRDRRVIVMAHDVNRGVGAAMRTGYRRAVEEGAEIIVKMDSDNQMDPGYLPHLILPIALGAADYSKGNRFLRPETIYRMPKIRLLGNAVLSFVTKLSTGYWSILDPTNGYTAISREALGAVDLERLDDRYFFESSMLVELGMARAVVLDVPMPSRYRGEESHLRIVHSLPSFALKHSLAFLHRLFYRYLLTDFSAVSLLIAISAPLMLFGSVFGLQAWIRSALFGTPATAGTVMLAAFTTAGGAYCLVQALIYDIMSVPQRPLSLPRLTILKPVGWVGKETPEE